MRANVRAKECGYSQFQGTSAVVSARALERAGVVERMAKPEAGGEGVWARLGGWVKSLSVRVGRIFNKGATS